MDNQDLEERVRSLEMQLQFYSGLRATQGVDGLLSFPDKTKLDSYVLFGDNATRTAAGPLDLNVINTTGFYDVSGSTNQPAQLGPGNAWWFLQHIEHRATNYSVQVCYPLDSGGQGDFWAYRRRVAGTWKPWRYYGDTPWTNFTFNSYFAAYGSTFPPPGWRYQGTRIELRGLVKVIATIGAGWGTGMIPPLPVTDKIMNCMMNTGGSAVAMMDFRHGPSYGQLTCYVPPSTAVNSWFTMDGLSYDLA